MKRPGRTKTKKFTILLLMIFIIALNIIPVARGEERGVVEVMVRRGDTLWEIAHSYGNPEKDIRYIVYQIKKYNNLNSGVIHPGQLLKVPQ